MVPPAEVGRLVARFEEQRDDYRRGRYNEAQLREDFLNPLFKALGWDVHNERGWSEAYREVIHEAAIKVGGRTKAPDYCFRAGGGKASFFVEAKKPSVDIREAVSPAYQLRRYAWSAKLPVSILTDFEEFAVYDCRVRPVKNDKASTGRIIYGSPYNSPRAPAAPSPVRAKTCDGGLNPSRGWIIKGGGKCDVWSCFDGTVCLR